MAFRSFCVAAAALSVLLVSSLGCDDGTYQTRYEERLTEPPEVEKPAKTGNDEN